jgi:hypothetical protein
VKDKVAFYKQGKTNQTRKTGVKSGGEKENIRMFNLRDFILNNYTNFFPKTKLTFSQSLILRHIIFKVFLHITETKERK